VRSSRLATRAETRGILKAEEIRRLAAVQRGEAGPAAGEQRHCLSLAAFGIGGKVYHGSCAKSEPQIALERHQIPAPSGEVITNDFRGDPAAVFGCFMRGQKASQLLPLFFRRQVQ
jgi:hypothetical protein